MITTKYRVPPPQPPDLAKIAAREAGKTKFQGSRCKYGHSGIRYASTGNCVECVEFHRSKKSVLST